jgi:acetyl-CoA decarbonylase/synthase complex subunit beta
MSMFEDIPVEVGVIYEGERIRRKNMQVELGGPKQEHKFELARVRKPEEIEDGKVVVTGPDIRDMEEGGSYPLGVVVEVAGEKIEPELEGVIERRIHEYMNFIEGFMHLNQRYDIWIRIDKKSFKKGLNSFHYVGKILQRLFKSELPFIEKIQITFITNPDIIKNQWKEALEIYEARDAKARGLKDEEIDQFYGCTLCQSFAPTHICVITPQRYSNCGSISWFDGRASARVDPKGPVFGVDKGELLDKEKGEYSGVNEVAKQKSLGEVTKVWLYTAGLVHRGFKDVTVNGLPFSTIADSTAGGRQVDGFHGISIEYMRSPKFLQADGGWNRVVWMPTSVKERVADFVPKEVVDKIATESDVKTVDELKSFLKTHDHPVVQTWKEKPVTAEEALPTPIEVEAGRPLTTVPTLPITHGGFKIILRDAKIYAKKVIIRYAKDETAVEKGK